MLEKYLIDFCSPTLASLKLGSLFNYSKTEDMSVEESVNQWNKQFSDSGLKMYVLRSTPHSALIYVYRESALTISLSNEEIQNFLKCYGYDTQDYSIDQYLAHLRERIALGSNGQMVEFPHEIGVFLGYPLYDVKCFITNHGKNCKCTGAWKVYGDADQATKTFAKFNKCREVYQNLWQSGRRSVMQLTVAG